VERARRGGGRAAPVVGGAGAGVGLVGAPAHGPCPKGAGPEGHPVPPPLGRPQGGPASHRGGQNYARLRGPTT